MFWDNPARHYQNHRITRVYRHTADDITQAAQVGTSTGISYTDTTAAGGTQYWYWIRWESRAFVLGPSSEGVTVTPADGAQTVIDRFCDGSNQ